MRPNIIRVQMGRSERTQYQFICCRLMTHEITKYLLQRGSAHTARVCVCACICLGHGSHGNKQSILESNCGGGQRGGCLWEKCLHATACIYRCVRFLWYFYVCDNRMYRRTSNMAGLTYPPTALTALKVIKYALHRGNMWHFILLNMHFITRGEKH